MTVIIRYLVKSDAIVYKSIQLRTLDSFTMYQKHTAMYNCSSLIGRNLLVDDIAIGRTCCSKEVCTETLKGKTLFYIILMGTGGGAVCT